MSRRIGLRGVYWRGGLRARAGDGGAWRNDLPPKHIVAKTAKREGYSGVLYCQIEVFSCSKTQGAKVEVFQ